MTQEAVVVRTNDNGTAEVAVTRTTACGGNCGNCESCVFQNEIKTIAENPVGAVKGQRVVIESKTSTVFRAAVLVYLFPILMFLCGYAISYALGASEGLCVCSSFAALIISAFVIVLVQNRIKNKISYEIICVKES